MPRASASKTTAAKTPAAKKVAAKKKPRTAKRAAVSRGASKETPVRKAPTIIESNKRSVKFPKAMAAVLALALIIGGGSIAVGMSDSGEINVDTVLSAQSSTREVTDSNGETRTVSVPKADPTIPKSKNGGLSGKGKSTPTQTAPAPVAVSSSTTDTASSSDSVAEEDSAGEVAGATDSSAEETDQTEEPLTESVETDTDTASST